MIVLLSAGLDSTVNLFKAVAEGHSVVALTFNYGQKAALKEIKQAQALTDILKIRHQVIDLPFFKNLGRSSLTHNDLNIPVQESVQITDHSQSLKTAQAVWVPNRNGVFLNIAAAFAEAYGMQYIVPGFNAEEASTFPDNSKDFLNQVNASFLYSTANHVKTLCWTADLNKTEIVRLGMQLQVPWKKIWPCYFAQDFWCGRCESCQRSARAFKEAGVTNENLLYST